MQDAQSALELAQFVEQQPNLYLEGLFIYPGHLSTIEPRQQAVQLEKISTVVKETLDLWKRNNLSSRIVSGGSTPTAYQSHLIPELTEIRPGTYIYNDMNCVRSGVCGLEDCAAAIVCTVISNAVPGKVILDAGSKTLTSDRLSPNPEEGGHGLILEYPEARIVD